MTPETFQKIKFGNVLTRSNGDKFIVSSIIRDGAGKIKHIGLTRAIGCEVAGNYELTDTTSIETSLVGRSVQS